MQSLILSLIPSRSRSSPLSPASNQTRGLVSISAVVARTNAYVRMRMVCIKMGVAGH